MNHWANKYVGLPFAEFGATRDGINCWGLVVLVYADELGIVLPTYRESYVSLEERAVIAALVDGERADPAWRAVASARAFDVVTFRRGLDGRHIGVVVSPGLMLHVTADDCAKLEHYTTGQWSHRLTGTYRHVDSIAGAA